MSEKSVKPDEYIWGWTDEEWNELYTYPTRDEAIAAAIAAEPGTSFWTAKKEHLKFWFWASGAERHEVGTVQPKNGVA